MTGRGARLSFLALILLVFSLGTAESVIAGLLPILAGDLAVSISAAGLLVSGYALTVVLVGPPVTLLTSRLPRKHLLVGLALLFTAGNVLAALAPSYSLLMVARVACGLAHCTLFATALVLAGDLVPAEKVGSAVAKVIIGINLATVLGVPLGIVVADRFGWRATFWCVAAVGALSTVVAVGAVGGPARPAGGAASELRVLGNRRIQITLVITGLAMAGAFTAFTYLTPLLVQVTGLDMGTVGPVLLAFGVGSCVGSWLGGRLADRSLLPATTGALAGLVAVLAALAASATLPVVTVALVFLFGVAFFALNPLLGARIIGLASGGAPTLALSVNIGAVQIAIAFAGWFGGRVLDAGLDARAVMLSGAALAALGLLVSYRELRRPGAPVTPRSRAPS